jgi:hypothetical protein
MTNRQTLAFAYRYPFSSAAKEVIAELRLGGVDFAYLGFAKVHLEEAMKLGRVPYNRTNGEAIMRVYLLTYLYSRMLASATGRISVIEGFARAEARRSADAIRENPDDLRKVAEELKLWFGGAGDEFVFSVFDFLRLVPESEEFSLANQKLHAGRIYADINLAVRIIESAIALKIKEGLPISSRELPREVVQYARSEMKQAAPRLVIKPGGGTAWIERLLNSPIIDGRHRTVNVILAPYLVNVKGLDVDEAARIINEYIERCKQANPNTKITEKYIRYQCEYAKRKGLRPMSLKKTRELLGGFIDDSVLGSWPIEEKANK